MKKLFFLFFVFLFTIHLFSLEEDNSSGNVDLSTGLRLFYSDTKIVFKDDGSEYSLITMVAAVEAKVYFSNYLTVGLVAGYNWNHFQDSIIVSTIPLSLTLDNKSYSSMVFGLNLKSEPFSLGDFWIGAKGEFLYFKLFKNEWNLELPIVSGTAEAKHSFFQATFDLVLKYDGFLVFTPYIGPQIHFLSGKLTVSESLEDISAEVTLKHRQKSIFGVVGGVSFEFADKWEGCVEITLFSKLSLSLSIFYLL